MKREETMITSVSNKLAINGGSKAVSCDIGDIFAWPVVTREDEEAVLEVLRRGAMSDSDVTLKFEKEYAEWHGVKHALGYCNGTASILGAMFGCGIGIGDEVINPGYGYWASSMPILNLGAVPVFADIDENTLCIDPRDIERRITPRTKAILVVHQFGHACDMDSIMAIAEKHSLKVIEDVSHAQGGLYKGKMLGTIGHAGAMSLMSGKSFAIGEAGILITDDDLIFQRAVAFGFYERTGMGSNFAHTDNFITHPSLTPYSGLPLGGYKQRMNQTCSAMGRVQLKYYPRRIAQIQKAMNYFWDLLEGVPGLRAHRTTEPESTMGGWYCPVGIYKQSELDGLPLEKFVKAVAAEGASCDAGAYKIPLHLHPVFQKADIYGHGRPTAIAHCDRDARLKQGSLPRTESAITGVFRIPWFKHFRPEIIKAHAAAYRKVAENCEELLQKEK
jgi:dTDP-4-amino-4,6-dideoxygalactose transaminase